MVVCGKLGLSIYDFFFLNLSKLSRFGNVVSRQPESLFFSFFGQESNLNQLNWLSTELDPGTN